MIKNNYREAETIAVHYNFPLCEIKTIINGLEDYAIFYSIVDCKMHQAIIKYNSSEPYFKFKGRRVKLSNYYRANWGSVK